MHATKELNELYQKLEDLKNEFNTQMNGVEVDINEFHKLLISLSKKYPDHSELLEFIVFINDKLETNQTQYKQIISEVVNKLIVYKQIMVSNYENNQINKVETKCDVHNTDENKESFLQSLMSNLPVLKELKWTAAIVLIAFILISSIISPNETKAVIESLKPLVNMVVVGDK